MNIAGWILLGIGCSIVIGGAVILSTIFGDYRLEHEQTKILTMEDKLNISLISQYPLIELTDVIDETESLVREKVTRFIFTELDKYYIPQSLNEHQLEVYNRLKKGN